MLDAFSNLFDARADDASLAALMRSAIQADPLATLRVAAEVARTGRRPAAAVTRACHEEHGLLATASPEQVRVAMEPVLLAHDVDVALQWLHDVGVMALLLPEL